MTCIHEAHTPIIKALIDVQRATAAAEEAYRRKVTAEVRLAELVSVKRRDKDTGFDADFHARDTLVNALMAAHGYCAPAPESSA